MEKRTKVIMTLLIVLAIVLISTMVLADYTPENFKEEIKTTGKGTGDIQTLGGKIVGIIQIVGTISAVGTIMVLGIKYMMGSAEEKAEYKKTMIPYLVGAVLLFGASNITAIVYTWASAV